MLIVFSGLPGVGKTTIARELARETGAVCVRIDAIEQALRDAGWTVEGEGYRVAYVIAEDNLRLGRTVIADCVNPWPLTRREWRAVAERAGVRAVDIEVVCPDVAEHRRRAESRAPDIAGHQLPAWSQIVRRDYQPWTTERIVIDSARLSAAECAREIVLALGPEA